MSDKTIEMIFGSAERVKIIKLFVFNPEKSFSPEVVSVWMSLSKARVQKEIKRLARAGLIVRKGRGFVMNKDCAYLPPLQEFLSSTNPGDEEIVKKLKGVGKIQLLILAGIFIQDSESRLDILIVADKINKTRLAHAIKSLESQVGKELLFSVFDRADFKYRLDMKDKLIMDVLDFPHEKVLNKLGI